MGLDGGAAALALRAKAPVARPVLFVQVGRLLADPATGRVDANKTVVIQNGRVREIRDGFVAGTAR